MVLVDPIEKVYLAIIEFKRSGALSVLSQAANQIDVYKSSSEFNNKDIPAYIVVEGDDDFLVHQYDPNSNSDDSVITRINKKDFPTFSQLSFSIQAKERGELDKKQTKILDSVENRKRLLQGYGKSAAAGIVAAIIGVILSFYTSLKMGQNEEYREYNARKDRVNDQNWNEFIERYKKAMTVLDSLKKRDSLYLINNKKTISQKDLENRIYINVSSQLKNNTESRLKNIENMLSKEPEKTLSILELKSQISELKILYDNNTKLNEVNIKLNEEKITNLKEKTDFLNNIIWGLFSSIVVTLIGVVVTAYYQPKKND